MDDSFARRDWRHHAYFAREQIADAATLIDTLTSRGRRLAHRTWRERVKRDGQ
jgi:hypothetical protein